MVLQSPIDCSTVTINLYEVTEYTEPEPESFPVRVLKGFTENLHETFDWLIAVIEWFLIHIPSLIVSGIVVSIYVIICRKTNAKRAARKADRIEKLKEEGLGKVKE